MVTVYLYYSKDGDFPLRWTGLSHNCKKEVYESMVKESLSKVGYEIGWLINFGHKNSSSLVCNV